MLILAFEECYPAAARLAQQLCLEVAMIELHRFPDGEIKIRLPLPLPPHTVIFSSLQQPNEKLIALLFASRTAREQQVRELTLIAPYLCYMRQDRAFNDGEAISQLHIGRLLAELFDRVVTVDPHLHRVDTLASVLPAKQVINLSAAPLIGQFLKHRFAKPLILGPDAESRQWVAQVAHAIDADTAVCDKIRHGDTRVTVTLPALDINGREVVLVDDIISTGGTLARVTEKLLAAGALSVSCFATHALISPADTARLQSCGIQHIWSTDSVPHPSNVVALAPLLGDALTQATTTP